MKIMPILLMASDIMKRYMHSLSLLLLSTLILALNPQRGIADDKPSCPSNQIEYKHACFGAFNYANGERYSGFYQDNQKNGQGTQIWPNGSKYIGSFRNGLRDGQGTFFFVNGDKFVGEWREDKRTGLGVLYASDGSLKGSGLWNDSVLIQQGPVSILQINGQLSPTKNQLNYNNFDPLSQRQAKIEEIKIEEARKVAVASAKALADEKEAEEAKIKAEAERKAAEAKAEVERKAAEAKAEAERKAAEAATKAEATAIVRSIVSKLKEARCYNGPDSNSWSPSIHAALKNLISAGRLDWTDQEPSWSLLARLETLKNVSCLDNRPVPAVQAKPVTPSPVATPAPSAPSTSNTPNPFAPGGLCDSRKQGWGLTWLPPECR